MSLLPPGVSFSNDEQMLLDAARAFSRDELLAADRQWDRDESSVAEILPRLSEMGFLSMLLPESLGGLGCSYCLYAAMIHEIAYYSPSTAVTLSVHNMVGGVLDKCLVEPFRSEIISHWGTTESFGAFCVSEADAGSDVSSIRCTAVPKDEGYVISGEKMWITNGMNARWFLTLTRIQGGASDGAFCAFLIDGNTPGINRTKILGKMGIRGSETAVISFQDVFVPSTFLVGNVGEGMKVCLTTLNQGRVSIAAQASGIAEACLDEMVRYAGERKQFGRPIGRLPAIAEMIADSAVDLAATRELIWKAAQYIDEGIQSKSASSMAKLFATEAANRIADRAVQVHGGTGYVHECRVEQLFRDVRVTTIYEGTSQIQRVVIGRELERLGVSS